MLSKYELNLVLDANFSATEILACKTHCEELIDNKNIKQIDDIWLLKTAYPIKGQDQAYYITYLLELDGSAISELKKELSIVKGIAKFFLYGIDVHEDFFTFSEMTTKYNELFPVEEEAEEDEETDIDDEWMIDAPTQDQADE